MILKKNLTRKTLKYNIMCKDIFISHAWGIDSNNRDNHIRCKLIADLLINKGYSVWFDTYDMCGNIDSCIMNGINNCSIFIICITEKYFAKINTAINTFKVNDNCFKEWNYAMFKQKTIIPIIMDNKSIYSYNNEDGIIQMYLSSAMYINFSENLINDKNLLFKTLKNYNIYTNNEKKIYNIKTNTSFDNLLLLLNEKIKTISSKKKKFY